MFQDTLKKLRKDKNLNQKDIAEILEIARITYSHYESGERIIPIERLNTLAKFYNVSIDYIFGITKITNYKDNKENINQNISGERIKEFRKENKLTQGKLANKLNTSISTISGYELKKCLIPTIFLFTICKEYHISADYLLGKIDKPKYLK